MIVRALQMHEKDNVVTLLSDALAKDIISVIDLSGRILGSVLSREEVPRGHKAAVVDIGPNTGVIKYGEKIGQTMVPIKKGQWVHLHNLESMRGRGDLNG